MRAAWACVGVLAGCGLTEVQYVQDVHNVQNVMNIQDAGVAAGADGGVGQNPADAGTWATDAGSMVPSPDAGSAIDPNLFWVNDPPPMWCGPDGGTTPPMVPGGTPDCPDDKNRQGCPCTALGATAPCWPGLRANRNLGVCKDGVATCQAQGEFGLVWSECRNYVAPLPGATAGAAACKCFSAGQWALANLSPCFIFSNGQVAGAVSTYIDANGVARCPSPVTLPPSPQPGTTFTTHTLKVDCAGKFHLCYELKAGDANVPSPTDCSMVKVCVDVDYGTANVAQPLPELPAWTSPSPSCAAQFAATGGYGEMSVTGQSVRCDAIDDGHGAPKIFNRVPYCPLSCYQNPGAPGCADCMQGGSGSF
jgi:hypothetical protein